MELLAISWDFKLAQHYHDGLELLLGPRLRWHLASDQGLYTICWHMLGLDELHSQEVDT